MGAYQRLTPKQVEQFLKQEGAWVHFVQAIQADRDYEGCLVSALDYTARAGDLGGTFLWGVDGFKTSDYWGELSDKLRLYKPKELNLQEFLENMVSRVSGKPSDTVSFRRKLYGGLPIRQVERVRSIDVTEEELKFSKSLYPELSYEELELKIRYLRAKEPIKASHHPKDIKTRKLLAKNRKGGLLVC